MTIPVVERIETLAGDYYPALADLALSLVDETDIEYAAFDFNGVEVCINNSTNLELLQRDLDTATLLGWQTIGPVCVEEYPVVVHDKIAAAKRARQLEIESIRQKRRDKVKASRKRLAELGVDDFVFDVPARLQADYATERYRRAHLPREGDYQNAASRWAIEIARASLALSRESGYWIGVHVKEASFLTEDAMDEGFSGFQFSLAIDILERYWLYGDVVRRARSMGWPK